MMTVSAVLSIRLPVTMRQNLDARFNLNQARLGRWQSDSPRHEESWPEFAGVRR